MQSYIVLSVCLFSCILVHANGSNISTGYKISIDIIPNAKNIFRRSISDESGAEEDEFITTMIRNITIIEEEVQSEINDFSVI
ncbi:hypothetical protein C0J52_26830 [Blattella germanica]|nr:hypothetical protein C0J52_26830 [Blattella germanica]